MSWIAAAVITSGVIGAVGANKAAKTQAQAANEATQAERDMFSQTRSDLMPWQDAGKVALGQLNEGLQPGGQFEHMFNLNDFQESPAYQFNLQQGKLALDKAAAARGKFYAPSTLQDIAKYSQGLASNEFQNAFSNYQTGVGNIWNRLQQISGGGQNAAAQTGAFGTQVGGQIGNNITGAGNALAAGQVGVANALSGAGSNIANNLFLSQLLQNSQRSSVNPYTSNQMGGPGGGGGME